MMTSEKVLEKVVELIQDIEPGIYKEAERLLDSGAVEVSEYEDNFILPKMLVSVALEKISGDLRPPKSVSASVKRDIANLRCF